MTSFVGKWHRKLLRKLGQKQRAALSFSTSLCRHLKKVPSLYHGGTSSEHDWRRPGCEEFCQLRRGISQTALVPEWKPRQRDIGRPIGSWRRKPAGEQSDGKLR